MCTITIHVHWWIQSGLGGGGGGVGGLHPTLPYILKEYKDNVMNQIQKQSEKQ